LPRPVRQVSQSNTPKYGAAPSHTSPQKAAAGVAAAAGSQAIVSQQRTNTPSTISQPATRAEATHVTYTSLSQKAREALQQTVMGREALRELEARVSGGEKAHSSAKQSNAGTHETGLQLVMMTRCSVCRCAHLRPTLKARHVLRCLFPQFPCH
jgi:hypothetical protein